MNLYRLYRGPKTCFTSQWNLARLKAHGVHIGKNFRSCGIISLALLSGSVDIGDNVYINSNAMADPVGGQDRTIFQASNNGHIRIGNNVGISNSTFCSSNSIEIRDQVVIGASCKIYDNDFHSSIAEYRLNGNTHVKSAPVLIKKRAFIGAHSIILKGVTIGEEAVIGAGSVVACDVPDGEIWAGNPARFIKKVPEKTKE